MRCSSPHHIRDFHGVTATSNFTWGRALGTGTTSQATSSNTALDNYNLQNNYGLQSFDIKFIYNVAMYYSPKVFQRQKGVVGKVLGGWTFSPLFTAQSGACLRAENARDSASASLRSRARFAGVR